MSFETAQRAIDFFIENCTNDPNIIFYGGEPFLQYDLMQLIINYVHESFGSLNLEPTFSVTTNGTLLDEEKIQYCYKTGVELSLSFDGIKKAHELGREKGSYNKILKIISIIRSYDNFPINTVSVVTPYNIGFLTDSIYFLLGLGVDDLSLTYQMDCEWTETQLAQFRNQYKKAYNLLVNHLDNGGKTTFDIFKLPDPLKPVFKCNPASNGLTITPTGDIFGCLMLIPWSNKAINKKRLHRFKRRCIGNIAHINEKILKKKQKILCNDPVFFGQFFRRTSKMNCSDCEHIGYCKICPAMPLIFSDDQVSIPDFICEIKKMIYNVGLSYF